MLVRVGFIQNTKKAYMYTCNYIRNGNILIIKIKNWGYLHTENQLDMVLVKKNQIIFVLDIGVLETKMEKVEV